LSLNEKCHSIELAFAYSFDKIVFIFG